MRCVLYISDYEVLCLSNIRLRVFLRILEALLLSNGENELNACGGPLMEPALRMFQAVSKTSAIPSRDLCISPLIFPGSNASGGTQLGIYRDFSLQATGRQPGGHGGYSISYGA